MFNGLCSRYAIASTLNSQSWFSVIEFAGNQYKLHIVIGFEYFFGIFTHLLYFPLQKEARLIRVLSQFLNSGCKTVKPAGPNAAKRTSAGAPGAPWGKGLRPPEGREREGGGFCRVTPAIILYLLVFQGIFGQIMVFYHISTYFLVFYGIS